MILRRILNALRARDWAAIGIELSIVVVGVFIGTLVANWNEKRLEKEKTERLLTQIQPELHEFMEFFDSAREYYSVERSYADVAFAGWAGRSVPDDQFVIAAYQASQVYGLPNNGESWALIFGAQQLNNIDDLGVRRGLSRVMTANYDDLHFRSVATPYREHVRQAIPIELQEAIRRACGDRTNPANSRSCPFLEPCDLRLSVGQVAASASRLRAQPELADELRWHLAAVATFMTNMDQLEAHVRALSAKIDATN
jgi:hypothetical protein